MADERDTLLTVPMAATVAILELLATRLDALVEEYPVTQSSIALMEMSRAIKYTTKEVRKHGINAA